MKGVTVRCGCCNGTGRVELTGEYLVTYHQLRKVKGEITGAELARLMGTKGPAMNNRLVALERHGLATSWVCGRERLYRAAGVEASS